jgi:hypothetical protein
LVAVKVREASGHDTTEHVVARQVLPVVVLPGTARRKGREPSVNTIHDILLDKHAEYEVQVALVLGQNLNSQWTSAQLTSYAGNAATDAGQKMRWPVFHVNSTERKLAVNLRRGDVVKLWTVRDVKQYKRADHYSADFTLSLAEQVQLLDDGYNSSPPVLIDIIPPGVAPSNTDEHFTYVYLAQKSALSTNA